MKKVAILLSAHNCRDRLLSLLEACSNQAAALSADKEYDFRTILFDDASTDGTAGAISSKFPDVTVVRGMHLTGWNRGILTIWDHVPDAGFRLLLGNGIKPRENMLYTLLDISSHLGDRAIVVGSTAGADGNIIRGGRMIKGSRIVVPDKDIPLPCEIFDGDAVLIPSSAGDAVGKPDFQYVTAYGTYEYGVRALRMGIDPVVAPGITADIAEGFMEEKNCPIQEQFKYDRHSRGLAFASIHFIGTYLKTKLK